MLNSMGLSYESFIDSCDWVMLENCGLAADTAAWVPREPEAMLHRSVAASKPGGAPALAATYFVFADGAYLGWAIARFWGVDNWATTLLQGPFPDGTAEHEEPELVGDLNRWEEREALPGPGPTYPTSSSPSSAPRGTTGGWTSRTATTGTWHARGPRRATVGISGTGSSSGRNCRPGFRGSVGASPWSWTGARTSRMPTVWCSRHSSTAAARW